MEVAHQPTQRLRALTGVFVAYDKLGDGQAAVPVLREVVALAPSDVRAKVRIRATLLLASFYACAQKPNSTRLPAQALLAGVLKKQGGHAKEVAELLSSAAGTMDAFFALAAEQRSADDIRSAIASLNEALAIDSRHPGVRFALGKLQGMLAQWVRPKVPKLCGVRG